MPIEVHDIEINDPRNVDVIVPDYVEQNEVQEGKEVLQLVKDGGYKSWEPIQGKSNVRIGEVCGKRYVAKTKWVRAGIHKELDRLLAIGDSEKMSDEDRVRKRQLVAMSSVSSEISMVGIVEKILDDFEIKKLCNEIGIKELKLVPPLFAVVDKVTKEETTIYSFVEGEKWIDWIKRTSGKLRDVGRVMDAIVSVAKRFGVDAHDTNHNQFIYDEATKVVYVVDIEGYHFLQD